MHETYGEPDDEIGKHKLCNKCGLCIECGDCNKFGCGAKTYKRKWGRTYIG